MKTQQNMPTAPQPSALTLGGEMYNNLVEVLQGEISAGDTVSLELTVTCTETGAGNAGFKVVSVDDANMAEAEPEEETVELGGEEPEMEAPEPVKRNPALAAAFKKVKKEIA